MPRGRAWAILAALAVLLCLPARIHATPDLRALANQAYTEAQQRFTAQPTNSTGAWQFGRACFDLAEFATNSTERATLAEQGIGACRGVISRDPDSVPAHYYLALNLGQLARTRGIGALKLVNQMEREFLRVIELDKHFDYAGAHRAVGLLYRDAPAIASVGSRSKAKHHMQKAVELAPVYPGNRLNLIESYLKWGDRTGAARELKALEAALPEAKARFIGREWVASWAEWTPRLEDLRAKVEHPPASLKSPRAE